MAGPGFCSLSPAQQRGLLPSLCRCLVNVLWVGMRFRVKKCKPPRSLVSPSSWTVITFCLVRGKKRWTDLDWSQIYRPVMRWAGVKLPSFNMYEAPGQASWEVLGMQRFLRQSPCHWEANALVRETSSDRPPSGFQAGGVCHLCGTYTTCGTSPREAST